MIICADARHLPLIDGCVDCCVTSPPYFCLRDYRVDGQIGIERTPAEYITQLVLVFEEVSRVLKPEGTLWLNIGDSYAASGRGGGGGSFQNNALGREMSEVNGFRMPPPGFKQKDLIGIPWMLAFALREAGWYLRSDIIWSKPNPMPESVTDRPTKAHEYMFLLTKSKSYFYDADAIREPYAESTIREAETGYTGTARKEYAAAGVQDPSETKRRVSESIRRRVGMVEAYAGKHATACPQDAGRRMLLNVKAARDAGAAHDNPFGKGANKRSVWTVPTMPYAGAHFATFPEKLIEPCILAGCPVGGLVLDPFLGSGTVGAVATRFGRRWVGTDLSYHDLAKKRTAQRGLMFAEPA